jgi:HK97 family phage portal protein
MWPFGLLRRKSHIPAIGGNPLSWLLRTGTGAIVDWSYTDYIERARNLNPTASACVSLEGRSIAGLPRKVFKLKPNGEEEELTDHPAWELLDNPSPDPRYNTWEKWMVRFREDFWYGGRVYVVRLGTFGNWKVLQFLRPDRVTPVEGNEFQPIRSWRYDTDRGVRYFAFEDVLYFPYPDPLDDLGHGFPLAPARASIDNENKGNQWNNSLLDNRAEPSVIIEAPEGAPPLEDDQKMQLEKEFREKHIGSAQIGKPIAIGGGYKVTVIAWSPKDMDWLQGKVSAKVDIANVCETPPELIGVQDQKTFSNFNAAMKWYMTATVIPNANQVFTAITRFIGDDWDDRFGGPFTLGIDEDQIQTIKEDQNEVHTRVREDLSGGLLKVDEARQEIGMDAVKGEVGETMLVSSNLVPLEDIGAGGEQDEPFMGENNESEEDDDE